MKRVASTSSRQVTLLTDPDTEWVSLVSNGANQMPLKIKKSDAPLSVTSIKPHAMSTKKRTSKTKGAAKTGKTPVRTAMNKGAKKPAKKGDEAAAPNTGVDVHRITFSKKNFPTRSEVEKYLDEHGYRDYEIKNERNQFVMPGRDIEDFRDGTVEEFPGEEDGVSLFSGKLTKDVTGNAGKKPAVEKPKKKPKKKPVADPTKKDAKAKADAKKAKSTKKADKDSDEDQEDDEEEDETEDTEEDEDDTEEGDESEDDSDDEEEESDDSDDDDEDSDSDEDDEDEDTSDDDEEDEDSDESEDDDDAEESDDTDEDEDEDDSEDEEEESDEDESDDEEDEDSEDDTDEDDEDEEETPAKKKPAPKKTKKHAEESDDTDEDEDDDEETASAFKGRKGRPANSHKQKTGKVPDKSVKAKKTDTGKTGVKKEAKPLTFRRAVKKLDYYGTNNSRKTSIAGVMADGEGDLPPGMDDVLFMFRVALRNALALEGAARNEAIEALGGETATLVKRVAAAFDNATKSVKKGEKPDKKKIALKKWADDLLADDETIAANLQQLLVRKGLVSEGTDTDTAKTVRGLVKKAVAELASETGEIGQVKKENAQLKKSLATLEERLSKLEGTRQRKQALTDADDDEEEDEDEGRERQSKDDDEDAEFDALMRENTTGVRVTRTKARSHR